MKKKSLFLLVMLFQSFFALPQMQSNVLNILSSEELHKKNFVDKQTIASLSHDVSKRIVRPAQLTILDSYEDMDKNTIQPRHNVAMEKITLDGGVFLVEPEYEAATGEWYIAVESHGYTFRLCWYAPANDFCGDFSFDDISWDWTWGWYQSTDLFYEIFPSDINMTISKNQVGKYLTQIILDATIIDTNDNVYVLHIVHDMYTPKSTIETTLENTQITITEDYYMLDGNNEALDVLLKVKSAIIDGLYNEDYFDMKDTKITYNGVEQQMLQAKLQVQGSLLEDGSLGYLIDFSFYNQDTILHSVSMPASLPTVKDTIEISCTNLKVDESLGSYGLIMLSGSNDLYDIFVMYEGEYAEAGEYNVSVSITDKITWLEPTETITAILTLTEDEDGWHANIEAYGNDYNWYSIEMAYVVPVPTDTINISFDEVAIATYIPEQSNMFQMLNYGDEFEASMTIYGIVPGMEFTMENVYMDYSGIYDKSIEASVQFADIKGLLTQKGDTTFITASIIGFNAKQYDIQWWYTPHTPVDTVQLEMPVEFSNAMDYGYYILSAYAPDSSVFISLAPMTDVVAGTFTNDGMFGKFGTEDGKYEFYTGSTYIFNASDQKNYTVDKGTLTVEMTDNGKLNAEAKIICSNAVYYHIKMTTTYNTYLDYDEPYQEVDRTYTTADYVNIDNQIATNGYIFLQLIAEDESDEAEFFFYTDEADEDIIIPEGIYPINYTEEYGTVQANPGVQGNGVWPSFYAEKAEGGFAVPLWLLVSGTVKVYKDDFGYPHMEVNAFNSYGVSVHIVYDGTPTGLSNIQNSISNTQKIIQNGQLLIIRNNQIFNVMGERI